MPRVFDTFRGTVAGGIVDISQGPIVLHARIEVGGFIAAHFVTAEWARQAGQAGQEGRQPQGEGTGKLISVLDTSKL